MTRISDRTVLFADLRGSTALFETLGNAEATSVVTHCINALGVPVAAQGGHVVKTLGDGLMAVFEGPTAAVQAAIGLHDVLDSIVSRSSERGASTGLRALRLQVGAARGEVVEMSGDCFGDAVNVAARLLDHAGDNETLVTVEVLQGLTLDLRSRFRSLDRLVLRGRVEPVQVHVMGGRRGAGDLAVTQFGDVGMVMEPDGLRLMWGGQQRVFASQQMPVVLGRSPQATFCVDDSRVSRSHARVDWHSGSFQLTDLSYNGTYVRFNDGEIVSLRRGSCTLHGSGMVGLGGTPSDPGSACVSFDVLRFAETQPQLPTDFR
ncbi:Adenylate cyclase [Rubrivivax sp. A210]|uniref:adenylate/guanylate cyclase domain-containing protein n=1 Tax=Rubrivivax sp. A210 TaxID=2772301 RepID=UPI001918F0B0|nr:adenylate/guanylate cyclase domain-containing protein [Rubrivivax sp. A210]CAD5367228.1 Adenylate cyclase [Rubrivivax sp. A210]